MGQAPTSQARTRDTYHLRPSHLVARTLTLGEHTISKLCRDACAVKRGLVAAVKCYVRKARFFLCRQRTEMTHHYYRRHCSRGFCTIKGNPASFSVFRSHNCRPYTTPPNSRRNRIATKLARKTATQRYPRPPRSHHHRSRSCFQKQSSSTIESIISPAMAFCVLLLPVR